MKIQRNRAFSRVPVPVGVALSLLLLTDWTSPGQAVTFQAPGDIAPRETSGGASRGRINFAPPGQDAPSRSEGGASRGRVNFAPPGQDAPSRAEGGASRGGVNFMPPGDLSPTQSAGGAARGVSFESPGDDRPSSEQIAGGGASRNSLGAEGSTSNTVQTVAAVGIEPHAAIPLLPPNQHGRTAQARPTFFVYIPENSIGRIFFSVQDEHRNSHYQTFIDLSGQKGILSFTLPDDAPPLEANKNYEWYFVMLEGNKMRPDSASVSGWIKRVDPSESLAQSQQSGATMALAESYAKEGIWYDTLETLVELKRLQPSNLALNTEWGDLLEQVGLEPIAANPIVPLAAQAETQ
jgi:Domain of Unknown Function (DUF928)